MPNTTTTREPNPAALDSRIRASTDSTHARHTTLPSLMCAAAAPAQPPLLKHFSSTGSGRSSTEHAGYVLAFGPAYVHEAHDTRGVSPPHSLPSGPPSALAVWNALVDRCGFTDQFRPETCTPVTRECMVSALEAAASKVEAHSVVVVFFTGYGVAFDDDVQVLGEDGRLLSVKYMQDGFREAVWEAHNEEASDVTLIMMVDCLTIDGVSKCASRRAVRAPQCL